jgi:hypothetical protein
MLLVLARYAHHLPLQALAILGLMLWASGTALFGLEQPVGQYMGGRPWRNEHMGDFLNPHISSGDISFGNDAES